MSTLLPAFPTYQLVAALAITICAVLAWFWRQPHRRIVPRSVRNAIKQLVDRPRAVLALIVVTSFATCLACAWLRPPMPNVHDEFSYLLMGDTFAHGRLTNPTHPLHEFFETSHVIQQPTYTSKYPVGQGVAVFIGQLLWRPILGIWLSVVLATAATYWMMLQWIPSRWAALGGLLVALHPTIQVDWSKGYWGGAVAMIGGALVVGALGRLERRLKLVDALVMSCGALILANSRPAEGMLLCICVGLRAAWLLVQQYGLINKNTWYRFLLPFASVLMLGMAWMGYYNWRVTGSAIVMPYSVYQQQHGSPLVARVARLDDQSSKATKSFMDDVKFKISVKYRRIWRRYVGLPLTFPLLFCLVLLRNKVVWFTLGTCAFTLLFHLIFPWTHAHYFAPIYPLAFMLCVMGVRGMRAVARHNTLLRAISVSAFLLFYVGVTMHESLELMQAPTRLALKREDVRKFFANDPQKQVMIVQYGPHHKRAQQYVYNSADIDEQRIVWARDLGAAKNQELVSFYKDRKIWLFRPDEKGLVILPYK